MRALLRPNRDTRQVVVGGAQTSNGTTASATYANPTNMPTVTFIPLRGGKWKVYGDIAVYNGTAGSNKLRLNASAGSPTVLFSQEASLDVAAGTVNSDHSMAVFIILTVSAGVSCTVDLQAKTSAGTLTIDSAAVTNGHAIVAEELT